MQQVQGARTKGNDGIGKTRLGVKIVVEENVRRSRDGGTAEAMIFEVPDIWIGFIGGVAATIAGLIGLYKLARLGDRERNSVRLSA